MSAKTLRRLSTLVRLLLVAATVVVGLGVATAVTIATTQSALPGFEELERAGRGALGLGVLAAAIVGAGVLAGLAGILRALLATEDGSNP